LAFAFAQGVALSIPFVLGAPPSPAARGEWRFWVLPGLALEATAWGLFSSSFGRSVLGSAGLGGLLYVLSWGMTFGTGAFRWRNVPAILVLRLLLDGLALVLSCRIFCRPDWQRVQPIAERESWIAE